jgi:ABC-2 type transport system permease protein
MKKDFLIRNLRAIKGRAYPRIIAANREYSWVIADVVLPLLSVIAYGLLYRYLGASKDFFGFAVLGGAMSAFWLNVLWDMASQLYWERMSGNLQLYIISPISLMSILFGMSIGGMFSTTLRALATLTVGTIIFKLDFSFINIPLLILVFVLTLSALYGLGMTLASLYLIWGREAWHLSEFFQEPVYLVSGMYFPIKFLGYTGFFSSIIPLTLGLDGIRQLIFKQGALFGFLSVKVEIIILLILTIVYLFLAYYYLKKMEYLARKEGKLTIRWE